MKCIAFLDLVGTCSSAALSNCQYTEVIDDFNSVLKQVDTYHDCKIFGYSDNAYIETNDLYTMIELLSKLRVLLQDRHRYFTAAIDCGSLEAEKIDFKKGFSMKFTAPSTVDIYLKQRKLSGIGMSLSNEIVEHLKQDGKKNLFCQSIFQPCFCENGEIQVVPVFDIAYERVLVRRLEFIISDYLLTAASNERAGRYYLTPIISMIKSLDLNTIFDNSTNIIGLLSFSNVPKAFRQLSFNKKYSMFFLFALADRTLDIMLHHDRFKAEQICEDIICAYIKNGNNEEYIVKDLASIPTAVISAYNQQVFLQILYNMKEDILHEKE